MIEGVSLQRLPIRRVNTYLIHFCSKVIKINLQNKHLQNNVIMKELNFTFNLFMVLYK